jgi:amidase
MAVVSPEYSVAESGALVQTLVVPPTGHGPLDGLSFAVKDVIDIAGTTTGCGNPDWRRSHPPAPAHAVCVAQLLKAGAACAGKTVTDELAFGLLGENYFDGTPVNPRAAGRVPGGSSSGSASAVACGFVDFALGTDTGGSVRVPASYCGLYGMRPSHDHVSLGGVMPFAPSFDTVGVLARSADILVRAMSVLLGCGFPAPAIPNTVYLVREMFQLADREVQEAVGEAVSRLRTRWGERLREISIREIDQEATATGMQSWYETFFPIQWAEIWSCLGGWIEDARPKFGPNPRASFDGARELDGRLLPAAVARRYVYARRLAEFLGPRDLLCLPTTPTLPPPRGFALPVREELLRYYVRTVSLTCLAGVGRLPQVSLPMAAVGGVPVGLSLLARHGNDAFLFGAVRDLAELAP